MSTQGIVILYQREQQTPDRDDLSGIGPIIVFVDVRAENYGAASAVAENKMLARRYLFDVDC